MGRTVDFKDKNKKMMMVRLFNCFEHNHSALVPRHLVATEIPRLFRQDL